MFPWLPSRRACAMGRRTWHVGHRGSQRAMARAIASRTVMKLSWKWRSGRDRLRVVGQRPSGREGKMARSFGDDKPAAREHGRDVVMRARVAPSFVVVEAELALEVFVRALGTPALHDEAHELFARHSLDRQRAEKVVG